MLISSPKLRIPAVRLLASRPLAPVRRRLPILAIMLVVVLALLASVLKTTAGLGTHTYAVADFDALVDILADADSFAHDLVTDDDRVVRWAPAAAQEMEVRAADAAVRDFDVGVA